MLLVLWQLVAGVSAHAASESTDPHCDPGHTQCDTGGTCGHAPDAPAVEHDTACGVAMCACPCGHTPALREMVASPARVRLPSDRAQPIVERLHADPCDEHFRPPN